MCNIKLKKLLQDAMKLELKPSKTFELKNKRFCDSSTKLATS